VKKDPKKRVNVHLLATNAHVIFWSNVFCNTTSATSSIAPLQHRFYSIIFYSIASTPPSQHRIWQHHFNTTFATLSSTTSFQHHLCNIVFYNTASTPLLHSDFATTFNYASMLQQYYVVML
jgi:uncharacterized protein YegP (UPF0339 family)